MWRSPRWHLKHNRGGEKNADLSECVWTYMTINLKQIVTLRGKYIWTHENHKSKAYNRYTRKRIKEQKYTTEVGHQIIREVNKLERKEKSGKNKQTKKNMEKLPKQSESNYQMVIST